MIYEIWIRIDNEINLHEKNSMIITSKKTFTNESQARKISWNFIDECCHYEKIFGTFTNHVK